MCLIYPCLGLYIMFSSPNQIALPQNYKYILGIMLIAYGALRFFRAYRQYYRSTDEEDENS